MSSHFLFRLRNTGFRQQLILTFTVGIVCLALVSSMVTTALTSGTVRTNIVEQGRQATSNFARQSTLALLLQSPDNAMEAARTTLGFPDVRAVAIYDLAHERLLEDGDLGLLAEEAVAWPESLALEREKGNYWYFIAPVYADSEEPPLFGEEPTESELLGHVRVVIGKETLNATASDILLTNFLVSGGLAVVLLLLLLAITSRVTTPLKDLAGIMLRAERGEKRLRAELRGPQDIVHMETAFNTMMEVLEERERELEAARDAALEAARIKGEFAANVSHELRTPLNGTLGMLELLLDMDLTAKQREYAEVACNSSHSLMELIDDILDFSRVKSGKLKPKPVEFYVHKILEDVTGILSSQAARKGLDLAYHIEEKTPAVLRGEAGFIRQLLINLVGNAIKYTDEGRVEVLVRILESDTGPWLRADVTDTGVGISEKEQERIFEAFTQVDGSTTRRHGGTGLGLAICRQLVDLLRGEVGVESEVGHGSTFWFTAPVELATRLPPDMERRHSDFAGLRMLIVDSDDSIRLPVELALDVWDISHRHALEGAQAVALLRTAATEGRPYHITIVNEQLTDMKGTELLRRIIDSPVVSDTRVILAADKVYGRHEAQLAGVAACISKPVEDSPLLNAISSILRSESTKDEAGMGRDVYKPVNGRLGLHVVVAEDNHANQLVATGMLERLGCHIEVVNNGKEAVAAVERNGCELVLMDCHMPEMDGYEATRRIRRLPEPGGKVPIIAMTANIRQGDSDKCLEAGMDDYLPKPLALKTLRAALLRWVPKADLENIETGDSGQHREPEPEPETEPDAAIDQEVFSQLRYSIGQSLSKVIEAFLEDIPDYLQSLEKGVEGNDGAAVTELAHKIKGSSRVLGAVQMDETCQRLEEIGVSGEIRKAPQWLDRLKEEWGRVRTVLETECKAETKLDRRVSEESWQPRILVVDDERAMRFALRNVLEEDGYRIDEANNGAQALALCERYMPNLILMDAIMPVLDGFEACGRIHRLPGGEHVPVLIITALDDEESISRAFAAGAIDYISKPVHFAVLRQRVARLLHASKAERHIRQLAYHDTLTGLANRAHFNGRLEELLHYSSDEKMIAVLFLDLDRFKLVNDTFGHDVGDLLLKAVSERLERCVRAGDLVARLGGDEFTIILEGIESPEVAARVAKNVCAALAASFAFAGQEVYITTSIGISIFPADGSDSTTIIKHADTAMFRAKEMGGGYCFYKEGMEKAASLQLELETELRQALERGDLVLYYQPQVDIGSGRLVGAEALLRWYHPERGVVSPAEFIPQAEDTALIVTIGDWVLYNVCKQIRSWRRRGLTIPPISVNLSKRHLEAPDVVERISALLDQTDVPATLLELEITESAIMKQAEEMISVLHRLKEMELSLAIDDFGIGYSSLNYLKRFPIDRLKIDQSFVRDMTADPDDAAIISAIIALAHSLRLSVVAEGVETGEQRAFLAEQGCDAIQGYFLSKPVPAIQFEKWFVDPPSQSQ